MQLFSTNTFLMQNGAGSSKNWLLTSVKYENGCFWLINVFSEKWCPQGRGMTFQYFSMKTFISQKQPFWYFTDVETQFFELPAPFCIRNVLVEKIALCVIQIVRSPPPCRGRGRASLTFCALLRNIIIPGGAHGDYQPRRFWCKIELGVRKIGSWRL